jgi:hypothetical protein
MNRIQEREREGGDRRGGGGKIDLLEGESLVEEGGRWLRRLAVVSSSVVFSREEFVGELEGLPDSMSSHASLSKGRDHNNSADNSENILWSGWSAEDVSERGKQQHRDVSHL